MTSITVTTQAGIHYHKNKPQETLTNYSLPVWFIISVSIICSFLFIRGIYLTFKK